MKNSGIDWSTLDEMAREVQRNAYCPYSNFRVGAALLDKSGEIITGCNVENAAYPAGVCAETSAMSSAVARGFKDIIACSVIGDSEDTFTAPCGICRQILFEFNPDMKLHLLGVGGHEQFLVLGEDVLPFGFGGSSLPNK